MNVTSVLNPSAEPGWKNYDDFARDINTHRLPTTRHWAGKRVRVRFDEGPILDMEFSQAERVSWQWGAAQGCADVDEVCMSTNRYYFSFALNHPATECLVLILNTLSGRALAVRCKVLPVEQAGGGARLSQQFFAGTCGTVQADSEAPHLTRELLGYRTLNIYSPNHYYEHFYVNSQRYAWQNLRGEQFGHGDMDYATYYKFEPEMYLFTFREKIIPVCSVLFFDFITGRCTGLFMGISASGDVQLRPAGAYISKMSFNCYPVGVTPR